MKTVSIISKEPQLLQLTCWFETGLKSATTVTVQVGSRAPFIQQEYLSHSKIYFYDLANSQQMPVFLVTFNDLKIPIDSSQFPLGKQCQLGDEEVTLHFQLEFVSSIRQLQQKYCSVKEETDKLARSQGLGTFVRAESQFLSLYQRNEEIEELKVAEIEEEKYERYICNQIIKVKKEKFDLKTVMVLVVLFLIFGFLLQAILQNETYNEKPVVYKKKGKVRKDKDKKKRKAAKNPDDSDLY